MPYAIFYFIDNDDRFSKLKLNLIMNKEKAKQDILNLKNSCKVKCNFINFCDFGLL